MIAALFAINGSSAQESAPANIRVAVVNVAAVYSRSDIYMKLKADMLKNLETDIGTKFKELKEEYDREAEAEETLRLNPNVAPETVEEARRRISIIKEKLEAAREVQKQYVSKLSRTMFTDVLAAVHIVIDEEAKKAGYDIVLKLVELDDANQTIGEDAEATAVMEAEFAAMSQQATVLYFGENSKYVTDITNIVEESLRPRKYEDMKQKIRDYKQRQKQKKPR
ncbi:MAG: hypothetical protein L6Q71_04980 [Planctomycetes bacterium]|nr:hypothetical protein [Planctomycetota bacterium]NUQ35694.1 hypothetical protein [Planctomycetaceae bacterium]